MIDLDLIAVLAGQLPRQAGSFVLTGVEEAGPNHWLLTFHDPRITAITRGVPTGVARLQMSAYWGVRKDQTGYALLLQMKVATGVPYRAREWMEGKARELDTEACTADVRNRIELEECNGAITAVTSVRCGMDVAGAELLAAQSPRRLKVFLPKFYAAFFQVAVDAMNLIDFSQKYRKNRRAMSA